MEKEKEIKEQIQPEIQQPQPEVVSRAEFEKLTKEFEALKKQKANELVETLYGEPKENPIKQRKSISEAWNDWISSKKRK